MHADYMVMVGVTMTFFGFASFLNAWTESRFPRAALSCVVLAGVSLTAAHQMTPGGYQLADVPGAFVRVLGHLVN
jgi:hypothetical protein